MAEHLVAPDFDPTVYPVTDDMGTSSFEMLLRLLLLPLARRWLARQNRPCFVGADQFVYWERFNPSKCVAPDLYFCPALPPEACPDSLKLWLMPDEAVPPFALEVVSENKGKDYAVAPRKYEELGVTELVVYDPMFEQRQGGWRWQVYRQKKRGGWKTPVVSNEDRVFSEQLGCWLRVVEVDGQPMLRLGMGDDGEALFATKEEEDEEAREVAEEEAREASRQAESEAKRAEIEARRAESEAKQRQAAEEQARAERQARELAEQQAHDERGAREQAEQQALRAAREAVVDVCELAGIELTPARSQHLDSLGLPALQEFRALLKRLRSWPV